MEKLFYVMNVATVARIASNPLKWQADARERSAEMTQMAGRWLG